MKVFLDDERPTPDGWIRAYWPDEVVNLLLTGSVELLSLDHDLGDDQRGTGYDVILWIEREVALNGFSPPYDTDSLCESCCCSKNESRCRNCVKAGFGISKNLEVTNARNGLWR